MRAFKILQMTHTSLCNCYTPESYNILGVAFKPSRCGVIYRIIFGDHFPSLGHTAKWTPKNTRSILSVALAANAFLFFFFLVYVFMPFTKIHLFTGINEFKAIHRRSYNLKLFSVFLSASSLSSLCGRASQWPAPPFLQASLSSSEVCI